LHGSLGWYASLNMIKNHIANVERCTYPGYIDNILIPIESYSTSVIINEYKVAKLSKNISIKTLEAFY